MSKLLVLTIALFVFGSCLSAAQAPTTIGGEKIVTLTRKAVSTTKPEFTSITVLPGRGMQVLYATVNFPGKGEIPVLVTPDLATAAKQLDVDDNQYGNSGYMIGAAFLAPFANRIAGPVTSDGKSLTVMWKGRTISLPANMAPRTPGQLPHAMHGMLMKAKATDVRVLKVPGGSKVTGVIHAGDFGGHWFSSTDFTTTITLTADAIDATVVARNVGKEAEPMGISWHPWLNVPSGDRSQVRLYVPSATMSEMANSMPTGKLVPVTGTHYDFNHNEGTVLDNGFYDANLNTLERRDGAVTVRVVDPAAHYGIEVAGLSPDIKTIQMASQVGKAVLAIEHMYNFLDPFGAEWGQSDTGMVTLEPGKSTKWEVKLHAFVP